MERMFTPGRLARGLGWSLFALMLAGCQASGDSAADFGGGGGGGGGNGTGVLDPDTGIGDGGEPTGDGSNTDTGFPNDGSVGGVVLDLDEVIAGDGSTGGLNFICTQSASIFNGASTEVGANGLVGAALGPLLALLGGSSVSELLASVQDETLAIDTDLKTAAAFTQTATGLVGSLDTVDLSVILPSAQPAGSYAVYAVSFPSSLLDLGLLSTVQVSTLLNDVVQEDSASLDTSSLELLGFTVAGTTYAYVGYKTTAPYDTARISISSDLLSVDAGPNMFVHEMCTAGRLQSPPQ